MKLKREQGKKRNKRVEMSILTRYEITNEPKCSYEIGSHYITYWKDKNILNYDYSLKESSKKEMIA